MEYKAKVEKTKNISDLKERIGIKIEIVSGLGFSEEEIGNPRVFNIDEARYIVSKLRESAGKIDKEIVTLIKNIDEKNNI